MSVALRLLFLLALGAAAQHHPSPPGPSLPEKPSPLRPAMLLLREGKTEEARRELLKLLRSGHDDAETNFQLGRAHLADFYSSSDPAKRRVSLSLAMESLANALKRDADYIPALKVKSIIHARAELLYYDPNLAYQLASHVLKLQPHASEYALEVSGWMSGEVRFTEHSDHRVPHDPQVGLDRSMDLLDRVIDSAMPYSTEEAGALFLLANTLARRGNHAESVAQFQQALKRPMSSDQRVEVLRELGAILYRLGRFREASSVYFEAIQMRNASIDQWGLYLSLREMGPNAPRALHKFAFPVAEPRILPTVVSLEFKDIAPELGLNRFDGNGTCAWGDIDGDGDLDVLLAGSGTFMAAYRNDGRKFTENTAEVGLAKVPSGYSLNLVDYNNDGRLDLYIAYNGWNGPMKNRLYRNIGGKFEDVSANSGADDPGSSFVSVWGDLDNDGFLDIAVANGVLKEGSTPQIYRNKGNGTFENMTAQAGIVEPPTHGAIGVALGDYDRDGDLDLLINGLNNSPNRLYRNEGKWKFTDVTKSAGIEQPPHNGFVCFFFDYNNDAWPDILTTSLAPWAAVVEGLRSGYGVPSRDTIHNDAVRLFRNNKDGTFSDLTWESKLYNPMGAMGAGVADVDNDGYLDIYIGTGDPQLTRLEPNRFFRNNGDGTFSDLTNLVGFARPGNKGHGVAFVDIDNDGDLDIYAQLGGHYQGDHAHNAFYRNLKGNENNWLQVDVRGDKGNLYAVGAQLTLKSGDLTAYREIKGSEGFGATSPYRVHFGIGKRTRIESLEVRWPSGAKRTYTELQINQILTVQPNSQARQ